MLGVSQEVVSPADGIVGASLVEPGDPVEYGQEVVEIELLAAQAASAPSSAGRAARRAGPPPPPPRLAPEAG